MNDASPSTKSGRPPVASENGAVKQGPDFNPAARPIWEIFDQLLSEMPVEERNKLPADTAEKHDQYIRGLTKR